MKPTKEVWDRYLKTDKGKAMLARHRQSEAYKRAQEKYKKSDKAKANRDAKPEIYGVRAGFERWHTSEACKILQVHASILKDDPERLSTEFICKTARILK